MLDEAAIEVGCTDLECLTRLRDEIAPEVAEALYVQQRTMEDEISMVNAPDAHMRPGSPSPIADAIFERVARMAGNHPRLCGRSEQYDLEVYCIDNALPFPADARKAGAVTLGHYIFCHGTGCDNVYERPAYELSDGC